MMRFKKAISLAIIAMFVLSALAGCGAQQPAAKPAESTKAAESEKASEPAQKKQITIGLAMDKLANPYWQASLLAMEEQAEQDGVRLILQAAEGDSNKQIQQVENFLSQKVDAVICVANDKAAIIQAVKKCQEAKTPFICLDRPLAENNEGIKADFLAATDNAAMTKLGGEWLLEYAKKNNTKLKMLVLEGSLTDQNVIDRNTGLKSVVDVNPDHLQIVQGIPTNWDPDKALAAVVNSFQANPDINCIVSYSDVLLPAIMSALKQLDKYKTVGEAGHVVVASIAGDTFALDNIKAGYVDMDMGMKTIDVGKRCVVVAQELAAGKKLEKIEERVDAFIIDKNNFDEMSKKAYGYYVVGKTIKLLK